MSGLANLKHLLRDTREACMAARVSVHDGNDTHYYVNSEGDYIVTVNTLQFDVPVDANWNLPPGQFYLPKVNDEVMIAFDGGEFEGEVYVVHRTSSGSGVQSGEAGELAEDQTFVIGDRCEIRQAEKILMKSPEVEAKSNGTSQPTIRATTYRSSEDTMLTALSTFLTALNAYAVAIQGVADPGNIATPVLSTAITAVKAAITSFQSGASGYLTTVFKAE